MNTDFFIPVNRDLTENHFSSEQKIGGRIKCHTLKSFPDLDGVKIAIFGVLEDRLGEDSKGTAVNFGRIRENFYNLFPGNWSFDIADLGDIERGETVEDTYFALQEVVSELLKVKVIPLILGGTQDLLYAQYRAYDNFGQMVNLVNIDSRFDLGDAENPISNKSYVGKMVVNKPYNLFNYSNIGYQTYFNSQEEIELMDKLFFDAFRLGEVSSDLKIVEPVLRDADMVGLDFEAVSAEATGNFAGHSPNGFDGKEICALARYSGISDKVSSFGIYEISTEAISSAATMLLAQIMWYFAEGVNYRRNENTISAKKQFIRYQVPVVDQVLKFYKSPASGRWWIEIPFISGANNKLKRHTLLPCTQEDYMDACDQILPERWYKTKRKNEI